MYFPVTFAISASKAAYKDCCAPYFALFMNGQNNVLNIEPVKPLAMAMCLIISVSTKPGCMALTVTLVPEKEPYKVYSTLNNTLLNVYVTVQVFIAVRS